jgi:hypothetical protein
MPLRIRLCGRQYKDTQFIAIKGRETGPGCASGQGMSFIRLYIAKRTKFFINIIAQTLKSQETINFALISPLFLVNEMSPYYFGQISVSCWKLTRISIRDEWSGN